MTYDEQETLKNFHGEQQLGFPLLQDENAQHVNALGIRDLDYPPGSNAYGIPYPGMFWVGIDGLVRAKFAVPGFRDRPPLDEVHKTISKTLSNP